MKAIMFDDFSKADVLRFAEVRCRNPVQETC